MNPNFRYLLMRKCFFPLVLVSLSLQCFGTTAVFLFRADRIVAGADRRLLLYRSTGVESSRGSGTQKIFLIKGRFIIADLGINYMVFKQPSTRHLLSYSASNLVQHVEALATPESSLSALVEVLKRETQEELNTSFPVARLESAFEHMASAEHAPNTDKALMRFLIAGFEHGVARVFEINFGFDKKTNQLIAHTMDQSPAPSRAAGLLVSGNASAIAQIKDPASTARKRLDMLDAGAFMTLIEYRKQSSEEEQIRAVRALITLESETEPSAVGNGANIVVLPVLGDGSMRDYTQPAP